jgi:hypothetical protein
MLAQQVDICALPLELIALIFNELDVQSLLRCKAVILVYSAINFPISDLAYRSVGCLTALILFLYSTRLSYTWQVWRMGLQGIEQRESALKCSEHIRVLGILCRGQQNIPFQSPKAAAGSSLAVF